MFLALFVIISSEIGMHKKLQKYLQTKLQGPVVQS